MRFTISFPLLAYAVSSVLAQTQPQTQQTGLNAKEVAVIPPASIGYTGPMSGSLDGDNTLTGNVCLLTPRLDKMWMTLPPGMWEQGAWCGACMVIHSNNRFNGANTTVYVQVQNENGAGAQDSTMDTSQAALHMLTGKPQGADASWGFVSCVDAGLETGVLTWLWNKSSSSAKISVQVRGAALPIKQLNIMQPDSCDFTPLQRGGGAFWDGEHVGDGPFTFEVVFADGTSQIVDDVVMNSATVVT